MTRIRDRTPGDGGVVSGPPWHLEGRSVVDGVEHRVSPVCPHLGGIVNWNDADEIVGVPAARVTIRARRHAAGGPCDT